MRIGVAASRWSLRLAVAVIPCAVTAQTPSPLALGAWNSGATGEPPLTVRTLAPGFWVIRQSKSSSFEAPFMYLIAGHQRALLVDTGAKPEDGSALPLLGLVDSLLASLNTAGGGALPLLVTHSHGHSDHRFLDASFVDRPGTAVIAANVDSMKHAFGLASWPDGEGHIDLGDRIITVLPTPGHEPAHVMYYDATTATLLGGDMLYPGLLTIRDWPAFQASVERLVRFAASHRISAILGAHVEMTAVARVMYPLGSPSQPNEHRLALDASVIDTLAAAIAPLGDFVADDVHDDFILRRISPSPS